MDRIMAIIDQNAGRWQPWRQVVITDVSMWSATGEAYVIGTLDGQDRIIVYRDGREPQVGDVVWVRPFNDRRDSYLLSLPLPHDPEVLRPQTCIDSIFYMVGLSSGGAHHVLRLVTLTGIGETWTKISDCPASGGEPELFWIIVRTHDTPYHGIPDDDEPGLESYNPPANYRFFTYCRGGELFYSDDLCATWSSTGLSPEHVGRGNYYGRMYACTADAIHESIDYGASWSALPNSGPRGGSWVYCGSPFGKVLADRYGNTTDFRQNGSTRNMRHGNTLQDKKYRGYVVAMTTTGAWLTINSFEPYLYPDEADPAFSTSDKGGSGIATKRSWSDPGSDDGEYTVLTYIGGFLPATWGEPFIFSKNYRDIYGPHTSPIAATEAFFSGNDDTSQGPSLVAGGTYYIISFPAKSSLADAAGAYDESTLKPGSGDALYTHGSDAGHVNDQSTAHTVFLIQDTSADGGLMLGLGGVAAVWVNDLNHPGELEGLTLLDGAHALSGTYPDFNGCYLVAIDDDTEADGHCSFAIINANSVSFSSPAPWGSGSANTTRWKSAVSTMRADLGDYYTGCRRSICGYAPSVDFA